MKVKVFTAMTEKGLENKVNDFIADPLIKVKDRQFSTTIISYSLLITYRLAS